MFGLLFPNVIFPGLRQDFKEYLRRAGASFELAP
jgi:hypothetical protein